MRWDVLWCAGTNAFCMFPTVFAYRKNLDEWLLYLSTGLASVFYHLHHFNKYLPPACNFMLYRPIRAIDLVLSDMSACWITSAMTGTGHQLKVFLLFLPFDMYAVLAESHGGRWTLTGFWIACSFLYVFCNITKYDKKYLAIGLVCSSLELAVYEFLSSMYPWYYNWIHGTHHIFGFLSIYFYMKMQKSPTIYESGYSDSLKYSASSSDSRRCFSSSVSFFHRGEKIDSS